MLTREIIQRVRQIQIRTGRQVADVLAGEYVSVFRGAGVEFDEVRPYVPGDDVRTIDWNVTARSGLPYVKRYVEERQLTVMLMIDISASQDFGSTTRSKREATAELGALLAFSAIKNDDKVGLTLFHSTIEQYIPPRKGQKHVLRVIREIIAHGADTAQSSPQRRRWWLRPFDRLMRRSGSLGEVDNAGGVPMRAGHSDRRLITPAARSNGHATQAGMAVSGIHGGGQRPRTARQGTNIAGAMHFLMQAAKRKTVCFVVSDFFDSDYLPAMRTANRKHDIIAVHVADPREREIPDVGLVALQDPETGRRALYDTASPAFRRAVQQAADQHVLTLQQQFRASSIDFISIDSSRSVVDPLVRFFHARERRMRR